MGRLTPLLAVVALTPACGPQRHSLAAYPGTPFRSTFQEEVTATCASEAGKHTTGASTDDFVWVMHLGIGSSEVAAYSRTSGELRYVHLSHGDVVGQGRETEYGKPPTVKPTGSSIQPLCK